MKTVTLAAQRRNNETSVRALRRERQIPAIFYGKGEENVSLALDYQTFRKVYMQTGSSQLIDLNIEGKDAKKVLVHDIQLHPIAGTIDHVDFISVDLKKPVTTDVPVQFVGESPAVKDLGGILNTVKSSLTVKCLPLEIPHDIEIDISGLAEFSSAIHVSEVDVPEGGGIS